MYALSGFLPRCGQLFVWSVSTWKAFRTYIHRWLGRSCNRNDQTEAMPSGHTEQQIQSYCIFFVCYFTCFVTERNSWYKNIRILLRKLSTFMHSCVFISIEMHQLERYSYSLLYALLRWKLQDLFSKFSRLFSKKSTSIYR